MLYDKLKNYSNSGIYPFHMPGHKRNPLLNDGILPYQIDLTEINGFDNLHEPEDCIKNLIEKAANIYEVNHAFVLVNGATGGILSAIRAMTNYGDTIITARNCHKSVYNAIELCGLNAVYAMPDTDYEFGIFNSVSPKQIENLLESNPKTKLVVITSPTYEGVVSDIKSIAKVCHSHNALLFVDEAHGAHFPFSNLFPSEAVKCGADAAVVSLHKTLPSFTQTALLLTNDDALAQKLADNISVFETSSPSYVLMSSAERCFDFVTEHKNLFDEYINNLKQFSEKCKSLHKINILCYGNDKITNHSFYDFDIGKIVISTRNTNINGSQLAQILRSRFKIEVEMAYTDYVIAITSVCDTKDGFDRLFSAISTIDSECCSADRQSINYCTDMPQKAFNSANKHKYSGKCISVESAVNKTSLEYVWAYPPGIPLLVPGEIISKNLLDYINHLKHSGIEIHSTSKKMPNSIYVTDFIDKI